MNNYRKPKKCCISESEIAMLARMMEKRYYSAKELEELVFNSFGKKAGSLMILTWMDSRSYCITQETRSTGHGSKTFYKIITKDEYEKIAEEKRKNAKRRLLAAVSCGSTF